MRSFHYGNVPDEPDEVKLISDFWNQLRITDEIGAADRGALDELERKTTDCLAEEPPNLEGARHYTAEAILLISGRTY